ncbi:substrate-binding domain-containing protein [Paenibacillus oenotherae]|uniref:Substrate-binding domain-containing protein n=1 Tax=Paenibacillus oenotherae TaxID=1435645 RepID=A0ABS7D7R3_9BACL|nr:substrate-binding domain-containing protein [Paenibacillus oenotherae]MBW7475985.1 substrate-binding domain-containing protein [Paenibacillus oenotherae]
MRYAGKLGYGFAGVAAIAAIIIVLLLIFPSAMNYFRSNSPQGEDQSRDVTLMLRQKDSDFWNTVQKGAETAAKEFGVQLQIIAPDNDDDVEGQLAMVRSALKQGTDALIVAALDDTGMSKVIDEARIPVIAIDTELTSDNVLSFIGSNNYDAGQKAGKKMIELLDGRGEVAILSIMQDDRNTEQRVHGLLDAFKHAPGIEVLDNRYCMSSPEYCQEVTGVLMDKGEVDGIVALNGGASIGAAREVERRGMSQVVKMVAFDSALEQLELLQDGKLHGTIVQNPFSMGYLGVKHAAEAMDGQEIPERVDIPTKVIDIENMFWMDNQKLLFPFVK